MIVSAHDLCRTRLCRAENCERDAEPYQLLCWICARQERQQRAALVAHADELECRACHAWKPDPAFGINVRNTRRRHRHHICTECVTRRGLEARARYLERQRRRQRARTAANLAAGLTAHGTPRVYAPRRTT